jgi:hypothetical protein
MDQPIEWVPSNLEFHLFLGDANRTPSRFTGARGDRSVRWTRNDPGDGTVLASSARLDEADGSSPIPWASISTSRSSHMGLLTDRELLRGVMALHSGMLPA